MISDEERANEPVRFAVSLPASLHEWLRVRAFEERRSMAEVIREAVGEYRARQETRPVLWDEEPRSE